MTTLRNARVLALVALVALAFGGVMADSADAGCGGYGGGYGTSYASYGTSYGTSYLANYTSCYTPPVCAPVYKPCLTPVYKYVTKLVCQKFTYPVLTTNCHGCPEIAYKIGTKHVPVTQLVTSYVYR